MYIVSLFFVLFFTFLHPGSFTVGKIQQHSCHHHLEMVCLNGDVAISSIPADLAFLSKGLTRLSFYCSWRMKRLCGRHSPGGLSPTVCSGCLVVVFRKHPLAMPLGDNLRDACRLLGWEQKEWGTFFLPSAAWMFIVSFWSQTKLST